MNAEKLKALQISPEEKRRPQRAFWSIILLVVVILLGTVAFIKPWAKDQREVASAGQHPRTIRVPFIPPMPPPRNQGQILLQNNPWLLPARTVC